MVNGVKSHNINHTFGTVLEQVYLLQATTDIFCSYQLYDAGRFSWRETVMVYLDVTVQLRGKGLFLRESALSGRRVDGHFWRELIGILLYLHRLFRTGMMVLLIHQYWIITTQPCLSFYCCGAS